jgi:ClpP class serine protease
MNETIIYDLINSNGGIPLIVETINKTNWPQFSISIIISLIGFIFIFMMLWNSISYSISSRKTKCSLKKISKENKKSVMLIKHTESGFFNQSMIDYKSLKEIQKAILDFGGEPFDLILHTPGGSIFYTLLISKMLQRYKGKIRAFIPSYSMSGGTVLALSCDEINMNDVSCIGPIDPQLGTLFKVGSAKAWKEILKIKGKKAEDSSIAMNLTGEQYTKTIAKILSELVDGKVKDKKKFIKFLTSGDIEHGYQIFRDDLIKFGLDVKLINNDLNEKLLKLISSETYEGVKYIKFKKDNKFKKYIKKVFRK